MENEFKHVMSERTNEELVKIVTVEREDYTPTAIEAAELELEKRNIGSNEFVKIKEIATIAKESVQRVDKGAVGSGIRFLNFVIDLVAWFVIVFVLILPVVYFGVTQTWFGYVIGLFSFVGYFALMEIKFQKTIGKFVTKTKVVKLDGGKPENSDIISRTFCRLIPFDRISFLFGKNGIHDFLSKTKVIKDNLE